MAKTFTLDGKAYGFTGQTNRSEQWAYSATGSVAGSSTLDHEVVKTVNGGASSRQSWVLKNPVLAEDDSACACAGSVLRLSTLSIVLNTSNASTTTERQAILDELDDLIADSDFRAAFVAGALIG